MYGTRMFVFSLKTRQGKRRRAMLDIQALYKFSIAMKVIHIKFLLSTFQYYSLVGAIIKATFTSAETISMTLPYFILSSVSYPFFIFPSFDTTTNVYTGSLYIHTLSLASPLRRNTHMHQYIGSK